MLAIEHLQPGVVGLNHRRAKHASDDRTRDGLEYVARETVPLAERRGRDRHAVALVDLRLAVERQRVLALVHDDVRQQARTRTASFHRFFCRRDNDTVAALLAGELLALLLDDFEVCRHELEDLAVDVAEALLVVAAVRAHAQIVVHANDALLTRKVVRQRLAATTMARRLVRLFDFSFVVVLRGFLDHVARALRNIVAKLLEQQRQLVARHLLALASVQGAQRVLQPHLQSCVVVANLCQQLQHETDELVAATILRELLESALHAAEITEFALAVDHAALLVTIAISNGKDIRRAPAL